MESFLKIVFKLTQFFSAPTAYRMLMQFENSWVEKYDKSSLRYVMTAGENCNLAAWSWLNDVVGEKRCKARVSVNEIIMNKKFKERMKKTLLGEISPISIAEKYFKFF